MDEYPLLSIILVNWNRPRDTLDCIQSIRESTYSNYNIIVVDNDSRDDSLMQLRSSRSTFILLEAETNLGFTGGNNLGIRRARDLKADYIMLLNNDTFIAPDALEKMVQAAVSESSTGIVTPKILFHPQRNLIWAAGTDFNSRYMMGRLSGYNLEDDGRFDQERFLVWATGCAMLIRRELINEVGMLCDDYFAVGEDLDFSLRAKKAGYKIRYEPSAIIWHKESASAGGHDAPQYVYYQLRNYFLFHGRWAQNRGQLLMSVGYVLLYAGKRILRFIFQGRWRSLLGVFYGIRDATLGRKGRREYKILMQPSADNL